MHKSAIKERAEEILALVGLGSDNLRKYSHELSGGQKQRVAIARAWATFPDLLLMDEPFSSLDAITRENLQNTIIGLYNENPLTMVLVTHSIEEAVQLSNRVCVISPRPGRIDRVLDIDLPMPRDLAVKNSPEFTSYVREIQEIFRGYGVI